MSNFMYSGCICCYSACNFEDIKILCNGGGTCICLEDKCCLAAGEDQFPVGMIKEDGFICKIGLPCCTMGLKTPDTKDLLSGDFQCLCLQCAAQFPFGNKSALPRNDHSVTPLRPRRRGRPNERRADRIYLACAFVSQSGRPCARCASSSACRTLAASSPRRRQVPRPSPLLMARRWSAELPMAEAARP